MPHKLSLKRRLALAALAAPVLAGSGLAYAQAPAAPQATPVKVNELRDMNTIRLDGRVTDVFGNRFVLEDATGRTLVELGPRGENGALVKIGDTVVVDGAFRGGEVRADAISVGGGERVALERPRPDRGPGPGGPGRDGPERDGPGREGPGGPGRHGPGHDGPPPPPPGERAERDGRWFDFGSVDKDAAAKSLADAGYKDVTLVDAKRHHAEFTATDAAGQRWDLKVDENNAIAEREPYVAPLDEAATKAAIEKLGYTYVGDYETGPRHVAAEAKDKSGRDVTVELNFDGTLRKERFEG
ncbi:hypothetical protein [Aureimonas ureilytica]|uniref:hypothetical protein n=1 Tax=Aureimonas ureilytica TaxID=401562 RepID=UPI000733F049|nr:hypothetical protein [Aureimonas ureilytica]